MKHRMSMTRNYITHIGRELQQYRNPDKAGVKAVKRFKSKREAQIIEEQKRIEREETVLKKNGMNPKYVNAFQARWFLHLEEEIDEEVEDITWECRQYDEEIERGIEGEAKSFFAVCKYCGESYKTKQNHYSFCSTKCQMAFRADQKNTPKFCKLCGKEFKGHASANYCSKECRAARPIVKAKITRVCQRCGKEYESTYLSKYCSRECYLEGRRKPKKYINCAICGKAVQRLSHRTKYCGVSCRLAGGKLREARKGSMIDVKKDLYVF